MSGSYPNTPQFFGPNGDAIINRVENALDLDGLGVLRWGGNLTQNTTVDATAAAYDVTFANTSLGNPTILHLDGATGYVGIGAAPAATQLNNQTNTSTQTDGTYTTAAAGLGWTALGVAGSGYAGAIVNAYNNFAGYGLLVRTRTADAAGTILNLLGGGSTVQAMIVKADGKVGLGVAAPASKVNTNAKLQTDSLGVPLKVDGFGFTSSSETSGYAAAIINNTDGSLAERSGGLLVKSGLSYTTDSYIIRAEDAFDQPVFVVTEYAYVGIFTDGPVSLFANTNTAILDASGVSSNNNGITWAQSSSTNYAAGFLGAGHGVLVESTQSTSAYNVLNVLANGTASQVLVARADNRVGVGSASFDGTNPEKLLVNAGTDASVNVISGYANFNSYRQLNIKNINAGASASSDLVATADTGSETTNFVNVGINSSVYSDPAFASGALDAYLYNNGGNLYIGTATAAKGIRFHVAGTATANIAGYITSAGKWGIGNNSAFTPCLMSNNNTSYGDGTRSIDPTSGFLWAANNLAGTFTAGVVNLSTTANDSAMFLRIGGTAATNYALHAVNTSNVSLFCVVGNSRVGVSTSAPATQFANTNSNFSDGTRSVETSAGLAWSSNVASGTFTAGIQNLNAAASASGLLVRATGTAATNYILHAVVGASTTVLSVVGNSRVGVLTATPATSFNNNSATTSQTDGTTTVATTGMGWQIATTGYGMAVVNTNSAANSNGLLVRVARSATDASVARFLYNSTSVAMLIRADGRVGIGTATPAAPLDVNPTFAASTAIAQFGGGGASSIISLNYGGTADITNIKIGSDFTLTRNGAANPSISTSAMLEVLATALYVKPVSGDSGTINLIATNPVSGGRGRIGAYNTADSIMNIGNTYNGGSGEFFYSQSTIFRNGRVLIADTNTETFNANAVLELNSTTRALLLPRMTTAEKNAITAANGMMVYDATTNKFCGYAGGAWVDLH